MVSRKISLTSTKLLDSNIYKDCEYVLVVFLYESAFDYPEALIDSSSISQKRKSGTLS